MGHADRIGASRIGVRPADAMGVVQADDVAGARIDLDSIVLTMQLEVAIAKNDDARDGLSLLFVEDAIGGFDVLDGRPVRAPGINLGLVPDAARAATLAWIATVERRGAERQFVVERADPVFAEQAGAFPVVVVGPGQPQCHLTRGTEVCFRFDLVARRHDDRVAGSGWLWFALLIAAGGGLLGILPVDFLAVIRLEARRTVYGEEWRKDRYCELRNSGALRHNFVKCGGFLLIIGLSRAHHGQAQPTQDCPCPLLHSLPQ